MNLFEILLFNCICIICPLLLYLFYVAYNKNINRKMSSLVFNIVLLTSFYLLIKFDGEKYVITFLIMSIIPLIIAYLKKEYLSIILLSLVEILCAYNLFEINIYLLILEYVILFIITIFINKKYISFIFIPVQSLVTLMYINEKDFYSILNVFIITLCTLIIYRFIVLLMKKGEKILKYHMSFKEIEKEKQIRNSLFKITHEIKNPMAVCKGYFDMMNLNDEEQIRRYLPIIKEEIEHTLLILQDFLSMNKIKIEKDDMDINLLVEEVTSSFKPIFKNKKIDSKVELIDDEVYINGDYNRLKQVLINILKNSVEAINKENGSIVINTKLEKNIFEIIIKDNGIGMSDEVINHIAEPFFTTKQNGTGLGVALSKEILKAHGAKIEYYSEENVGTSALIKIPIEKNA